ncbi:glycosyltransferase family 87 protein [Paraburkholderia sp. J11-2]|uniref:glycosyltransferase family 87 protein n=1 Tax=Paraburkholderia sp. J11-2 TaxID=2805431 RepID=UPI002AB64396|nr:glycosyltransferase family 87 protein [Paraburkholderia sp. J11-2]
MSQRTYRDYMDTAKLEPAQPLGTRQHVSHWLSGQRLWIYPLAALAYYLGVALAYVYHLVWLKDPQLSVLAVDCLPFWSASHLALQGHAVDAYNFGILKPIEEYAAGRPVGTLPWLYPPTFLLLLYPLALLPFTLSAPIFLFGTLALFVAVVKTIAPHPRTALLAIAFPGSALVLTAGQNGLLTASLVGLGLVLLRRRPILAGLCFSLVAMKPQLCVLIPLALLASRSWRALGAMIAGMAISLVLAVLAFGGATLVAFVHNMGLANSFVESGRALLFRVPTLFAALKLLHAPTVVAGAVQALSALCAAAAVCYAWRRPSAFGLRAAVLVCASMLVSPYLYDYDLTWYGILIAWVVYHAREHGFQRGQREWLAVLWLAPVAGLTLVSHLHIPFTPLISIATLWMLIAQIARERKARAIPNTAASL